jgi:hypothetical protein
MRFAELKSSYNKCMSRPVLAAVSFGGILCRTPKNRYLCPVDLFITAKNYGQKNHRNSDQMQHFLIPFSLTLASARHRLSHGRTVVAPFLAYGHGNHLQ